ncbi:fungal-specific transcription factor domain-containing protein [Chaetomidium leptoderma]|uniref:Fungal-specific transcription factor domain-containing protein n=1 Tax=Chaetomidium leptoderma TaxID=669021 RepID=A0AAN6ZU71_9PEZI|nr:fungal-specific transcription factor domain-containing protein [Chaetomidium leptoderma]
MSGILACPPTIHRIGLRYPALEPLVPHLVYQISLPLVCDLLDLYFETQPQAPAHPLSPYVLGFMFRRQSFLQATPPRPYRLALLSSMLLVAAETSEAHSFLRACHVDRRQICSLLKGLALANIQTVAPMGSLDDVVACIHLGAVERDDDHGRFWFRTACFLAQAIELGRELPPSTFPTSQSMGGIEHTADALQEEEREERRRVWWLLYMVDRVFALYENRSPILLGHDVLQPMDDAEYQNGNFQACRGLRIRGPAFECNGHSIYAHLLPLLTILGEIMAQRHGSNLDYPISHHLEVYKASLQRMRGEAQGSTGPIAERDTETQLAIAYGTYMARVLGILMTEEGESGLASERHQSQSGTRAADVAAVFDDISHILGLDPDSKFMQFFFGIFLFRGLWPLVQSPSELQLNRRPTLDTLGRIVTAFDIHYRVRVALSICAGIYS